jgi:hypothetical protein
MPKLLGGAMSEAPKDRLYAVHEWRAAGILWLLLTSSSAAQGVPVAGRLSVEGTLEPVAGAAVYLLDSERGAVRAVLSDSAGDFRFMAPRAGRYSLRVERIGLETILLPPFDLPEAGVGDLRPMLRIRPIELDAVDVTADRVCDVDRDAGDLVRIWLEARKALMATVLSDAQGGIEFTIEVSERLFDLGLYVVDEVVDTLSTSTSSAFEFLEIDEASGVGWGEVEDEGISALYGPSPEILLSTWFTDHHCFGLVPPSADSLVGLEFGSIEDALRIGMEGTFWLSSRSWALRRIDFAFQGPDLDPRLTEGGWVELRTGDWGSWYVDSWSIRVPVHQLRRRGLFGPGRPALVGFLETAGRVLELTRVPE